MVTNAVNMDLKVSAPSGAKPMERDSGFSDVLGNVSADSSRRRQGLANQGQKDFGKEFHKEFSYAKKASGSVHDTGSTVRTDAARAPMAKDSANVVDDGRFSSEVREQLSEAADEVLSDAVVTVVRTVAEKGETPTKQETAEMMSDALRSMVTSEAKPEEELVTVPVESAAAEEQPETDVPVPVYTAEAEPVKVGEDKTPKQQAETAEDVPEKEQAAEALPMTRDELIYALADAIVSAGDVHEAKGGETAAPEKDEKPEESTVHVITPDSSFLMTQKHDEAAMLTGIEMPARADVRPAGDGEAFRAELNSLITNDGNEEYSFSGMFTGEEDLYDEGFAAVFTGRSDVYRTSNDFFGDRSTLIEKVLAKLEDVTTDDGQPITELEVVKDTAKMLGEMIGKAKRDLGLSETRFERVTGENEEPVQLMQDEPLRLSRSMQRSDRSDELDHILSSRAETSKEDDSAPKTQTYDAVHMSAHLMHDRTDTSVPLEKLQERADNTEVRPPEIQTAEQILDRIRTMQDDHMEFTMVLNPESLGRITVRLVMAGEKTAVEISAENPETRAILAARSDNLQTMLRENGVDLERYQVVSEHEDAQFQHQSYDGSSKNPYSRNENNGGNEDDDGEDQQDDSFYDLLEDI